MSKVILVIDKPSCCGDCPLISDWYNERHDEWTFTCKITGIDIIDTEKVDEECPLKPIPQKRTPQRSGGSHGADENYGWNSCIDEIIRGEEK